MAEVWALDGKAGGGLNRLSASVRIWTQRRQSHHRRRIRPVLIAFRLQSEFGHVQPDEEMRNMLQSLNRLSASVRIWTNTMNVPIQSLWESRLNRLSASVRIWTHIAIDEIHNYCGKS